MDPKRALAHGATLALTLAATGCGTPASAGAQAQAAQAPRFEVDPLWPRPLPNHWLLGSATGIAVDARDHVFVVNLTDSFNQRTEISAATNPPTGECCFPAPGVLEFDAAGNLVSHWGGAGQGTSWPMSAHGIAIDRTGMLWIGGAGGSDTQIFRFRPGGQLAMQVGAAAPAPAAPGAGGRAGADTAYEGVAGAGRGGRGAAGGRGGRAGGPPALPANSASMDAFGGATDISFDPAANEAFVADGARNRRIAVVDMNTGRIKRMWGAYGNKPDDAPLPAYAPGAAPAKQFGTPVTCAQLSTDGHLYVCDRQNNRIQVFRKDGSFVKEKIIMPRTLGAGSVWDVAFSRDPQQRFLYVADGTNMKVHILDRQSLEVLTSFGDGGRGPGQFYGVHSIATDSQGNIYTTETYEGKRVQKFVFKGLGPVTSRDQGVVRPGGIR
jgi:sugar lactone lactonase YvrE